MHPLLFTNVYTPCKHFALYTLSTTHAINMLTHAKIFASVFSLLYVSLSPVPEGALQRAEINRLAREKPGPSFLYVAPRPPSSRCQTSNMPACLALTMLHS
jgi:hypothetical protein